MSWEEHHDLYESIETISDDLMRIWQHLRALEEEVAYLQREKAATIERGTGHTHPIEIKVEAS